MELATPRNPMARISDIAKRLGVEAVECPIDSLVADGADGKTYDVWAIASAFLDKMEKRVAGPEDDLVAAVTVIVTMMKYGPTPGGGSFNGTAHAIAWDRASVFLDRMKKERGWDIPKP